MRGRCRGRSRGSRGGGAGCRGLCRQALLGCTILGCELLPTPLLPPALPLVVPLLWCGRGLRRRRRNALTAALDWCFQCVRPTPHILQRRATRGRGACLPLGNQLEGFRGGDQIPFELCESLEQKGFAPQLRALLGVKGQPPLLCGTLLQVLHLLQFFPQAAQNPRRLSCGHCTAAAVDKGAQLALVCDLEARAAAVRPRGGVQRLPVPCGLP
mmetsp:Transcript_20644/g.58075  ORF Transcript_20644/g.58075 Transcript_20644/m.58075 type:complete len:213 (+) Transcript_20644:999-1637(+)